MGDLVQGETLPRIADLARHHVTSPQIRNLHLLVRIQAPAMFDRIHQHFTKRYSNRTSFRIRQLSNLVEELEYPIGRLYVAASEDANPFRSCGEDVDAIIPARFLDGA